MPAGCPGQPTRHTGSSGELSAPAAPAASLPRAALATACPPTLPEMAASTGRTAHTCTLPPCIDTHTHRYTGHLYVCTCPHTCSLPPCIHMHICAHTPTYMCTHIPYHMLGHAPPHTHTFTWLCLPFHSLYSPCPSCSSALTLRYNRTHGYTCLAQIRAGQGVTSPPTSPWCPGDEEGQPVCMEASHRAGRAMPPHGL